MSSAEETGVGCAYCKAFGHETADCPYEKNDRRFERAAGCFFIAFLAPVFGAGFLVGVLYDAFSEGFRTALEFWNLTWKKVRKSG